MSQSTPVRYDFTKLSKCYNISEFANFIVSKHILPTHEENAVEKKKEKGEVIDHLNYLISVDEQHCQALVQAAKEFGAQAAESLQEMVHADPKSPLAVPVVTTIKSRLRNTRKKFAKEQSSRERSSEQHPEMQESTSSTSSDDMEPVNGTFSQVFPHVS